jgi:hypothetical protein
MVSLFLQAQEGIQIEVTALKAAANDAIRSMNLIYA